MPGGGEYRSLKYKGYGRKQETAHKWGVSSKNTISNDVIYPVTVGDIAIMI